jgi:hypothetical protein
MKVTVFLDVSPCSLAEIDISEAVSTSEPLAYLYETAHHNIPEDGPNLFLLPFLRPLDLPSMVFLSQGND